MSNENNNNTNFKVTIKNSNGEKTSSTPNYSNNFCILPKPPHEYNVYHFDDVEYTHLANYNKHLPLNLKSEEKDETKASHSKTKTVNTNSSTTSNNLSTNTQIAATHSINILNNSDTFSSFNMSLKENLSENQNKILRQNYDSSSLIIDLNASRRSNASSSTTNSSKRSNRETKNNFSQHGKYNIYDYNSRVNNDFTSFKCNIVPMPFANTSSNSIKQVVDPANNLTAELIVKDDASNCNEIHLLRNLLDRFENFYHGPTMVNANVFKGPKNLQ